MGPQHPAPRVLCVHAQASCSCVLKEHRDIRSQLSKQRQQIHMLRFVTFQLRERELCLHRVCGVNMCSHYPFNSGSAEAVSRQERWTQRLFAWLGKGDEGGRLRVESARGEKAMNRNCAEKCTVEETCARGWRCKNALG